MGNRVAWLIPCYNEAQTIRDVIQAIQAVASPSADIFVFDNASASFDRTVRSPDKANKSDSDTLSKSGDGSNPFSIILLIESALIALLPMFSVF